MGRTTDPENINREIEKQINLLADVNENICEEMDTDAYDEMADRLKEVIVDLTEQYAHLHGARECARHIEYLVPKAAVERALKKTGSTEKGIEALMKSVEKERE